jgi:hypothetical protein
VSIDKVRFWAPDEPNSSRVSAQFFTALPRPGDGVASMRAQDLVSHSLWEMAMETAMYVNGALAAIVGLGWLIELVAHSDGERLREALAFSVRWIR